MGKHEKIEKVFFALLNEEDSLLKTRDASQESLSV